MMDLASKDSSVASLPWDTIIFGSLREDESHKLPQEVSDKKEIQYSLQRIESLLNKKHLRRVLSSKTISFDSLLRLRPKGEIDSSTGDLHEIFTSLLIIIMRLDENEETLALLKEISAAFNYFYPAEEKDHRISILDRYGKIAREVFGRVREILRESERKSKAENIRPQSRFKIFELTCSQESFAEEPDHRNHGKCGENYSQGSYLENLAKSV